LHKNPRHSGRRASGEPESRAFSSYRIQAFAEMTQVFIQRISGSGYQGSAEQILAARVAGKIGMIIRCNEVRSWATMQKST
jgi:hypothetical protein